METVNPYRRACYTPDKNNASAFLARYMLHKPRDAQRPWNKDVYTVLNTVVDELMTTDGIDRTCTSRRHEYIDGLCQTAFALSAMPLPLPAMPLPFIYGLFASARDLHGCFPRMRQLPLERVEDMLKPWPYRTNVTKASLDEHVLVAQIYLKKERATAMVRNWIEIKGPKSLSTFTPKTHSSILFGGFLEAAIRISNLELVRLLLDFKVDITRHMKRNDFGHLVKAKKSSYNLYFLEIASRVGNVHVVNELLTRHFDKTNSPQKVILPAVCSGRKEVVLSLMNYFYHSKSLTPKASFDFHDDSYTGGSTEVLLQEACLHGDLEVVRVILSYSCTTTSPNFVVDSNLKYFDLSRYTPRASGRWVTKHWESDYQSSPVLICAQKGHVDILTLLLEKGANPHGEPNYKRKGSEVHAISNERHPRQRVRGLEPLMACAVRGDTKMARMLFHAGFCYQKRQWLAVIDILRESMSDPTGSSIETQACGVGTVREAKEMEAAAVWKFWQWLASSSGAFNVQELIKECDYIQGKQGKKRHFPWVCDVEAVRALLTKVSV